MGDLVLGEQVADGAGRLVGGVHRHPGRGRASVGGVVVAQPLGDCSWRVSIDGRSALSSTLDGEPEAAGELRSRLLDPVTENCLATIGGLRH